MGEIADAHLAKLTDKLIAQLGNGEHVVKMLNCSDDPAFDEYLHLPIERLCFLLDAAKFRAAL